MRLKKWWFLFWTTLVIGGAAALIVGVILQLSDQNFEAVGLSGNVFNLVTMFLGGLMFSIISQMGFFAYLTVNYIALSIFRRKYFWSTLQIALMIIVLIDLALLPYFAFHEKKHFHFAFYVTMPIVLLLLAWLVAYNKVKQTNKSAWVPTLFFMTAATTLEAMPVLQQNNWASVVFMGIPLLLCNAWQILQLHKLVSKRSSYK